MTAADGEAPDVRGADVPAPLRFEQRVFSGGGTRCFWHGGFASVVAPAIRLEPACVSAVSGAALSACAFLANVEERLFEVMGGALAKRESNLSTSWDELQKNGLTPHQKMSQEIV